MHSQKKARSSKKNKKCRGLNASFTILNEVAPAPLFGVEQPRKGKKRDGVDKKCEGWGEDW
jgi:hypothetical protein